MLYAFIVCAALFAALEWHLLIVENRRCRKCKFCYKDKYNKDFCILHNTRTYLFPEKERKWGEWNVRTQTCKHYKRMRRGGK